MSSKHKREILAMAREFDPNATIETTGGNHYAVYFNGPNGRRKVFAALSPSDVRAIKNLRRDMVQAARTVGLIQ